MCGWTDRQAGRPWTAHRTGGSQTVDVQVSPQAGDGRRRGRPSSSKAVRLRPKFGGSEKPVPVRGHQSGEIPSNSEQGQPLSVFRPSTDGMRPTHVAEVHLLDLVYGFKY